MQPLDDATTTPITPTFAGHGLTHSPLKATVVVTSYELLLLLFADAVNRRRAATSAQGIMIRPLIHSHTHTTDTHTHTHPCTHTHTKAHTHTHYEHNKLLIYPRHLLKCTSLI